MKAFLLMYKLETFTITCLILLCSNYHLLPPFMTSWIFLLIYLLIIIIVFINYLYQNLIQWPGSNVKIKPMKAIEFHPEDIPNNIGTIVIGSGSGGMTCGNILAQSGQKVLILEKHLKVTGGCTHTFQYEGCEWDTGTPSSLTLLFLYSI